MGSYRLEDGTRVSFRTWALETGVCVPGNAEEHLRVVETGFVGTVGEVEAYLTGLRAGKQIERGTFVGVSPEEVDGVFTDEPVDKSIQGGVQG